MRPILPAGRQPKPKLWPSKGLHATWLGHSTVLLSIDGFTILTDPVFSDKAGFHFGPLSLGIKRLVAPALNRADLPPIDLVLLSHAHMDHFDIPSLRSLESRSTNVITAPQTSDLLRVNRYNKVAELRWRESVRIGYAAVTAIEVNHWGARLRSDTYRGYNGYLVETGSHRILFAGDTAITDSFKSLHARRGIDLAIMPIGAYNPWIRYHCNPEQAWRMVNDSSSHYVLPVHHQTFALSREPGLEPIERLAAAAGNDIDRVVLREIGGEFHL